MYDRALQIISATVALVGCAVLAGWVFDVLLLRSVVPGLPAMVPNTALAFLLSGVALRLRRLTATGARRLSQACAFIVVALALLTLVQYVLSADLGVDRLLPLSGALNDGRMSPHTAFNFVIAGCALLLADVESPRGVRPAQLLALVVASVALVALVGYVYGVTSLYGISPQTGMALHTAAAFLLLSAGVLLLEPRRGLMRLMTSEGMGGVAARRLLTAAVAVPLTLGWLLMLGQRAGFYNAALASSLLVVGSILAFSSLIWSGAKRLEGIDAERREAEEARAQLLRRVVAAQEEERRRIARELHDQTGQHLVALSLQLELHREALRRSRAPEDRRAAEDHLPQVLELADRLTREVHTLAWELRPPELDHLGLQSALARYVEQWSSRSGVAADFVATGFSDQRLPSEIEVTLYRVAQEALTNVLKHARARNVSLVLERLTDEVLAVIEDDGCGFDVEAHAHRPPGGARLGILGMRERIESAGGTLTIESSSGAGTTLVVRIRIGSSDVESRDGRGHGA